MIKLKGKFINLSTSSKKLSHNGILLDYNEELTLLQSVPSDYEIDGFVVLLNKYLKEFTIDENERFHEKIVKLKLKNSRKYPPVKIALTSFDETIKAISKKYTFFSVYPPKGGVCYIGILHKIEEKTITLKLISYRAKWDGLMTLEKSKIARIEFGSDYIESLALLVKPPAKRK